MITKHSIFLLVQEKQKYEILANTFKSLDDAINLYCELQDRYPGIIAIVDGVRSPVSTKNMPKKFVYSS